MKSHLPLALLCALGFAASTAFGQASMPRIGGKAQPAPPPATTAIANPVLPGAPSASGLASPFPPGAAALAVPGTSAAGTTLPEADPSAPPPTDATAVMGAGPYGTRGMTRQSLPGPVSAVDIARSFLLADGNRDGELTRAEAARLAIMPLSFEEMDANHDDRLTRSEYEEAVR